MVKTITNRRKWTNLETKKLAMYLDERMIQLQIEEDGQEAYYNLDKKEAVQLVTIINKHFNL